MDDKKWLHQKLTDQINHEFELLGHRMSWLLMSNAFLFTAHAISIGNLQHAVLYKNSLNVFIYGLPIIGIVICIISLVSMNAARRVIWNRKIKRQEVETIIREKLSISYDITVPLTHGEHSNGNVSYIVAPIIIMLLWSACYVGIIV